MRSPLQTARRAARLDPRERRHVVRALAWLVTARACLAVVDYGRLRRAIGHVPARRLVSSPITADECARAISRATLLGGGRCLARGVAADVLLRRDGHRPTMTIGVRLDTSQQLHAHAWVEAGGVIVCGGEEAGGFVTLRARPAP